VICTSVYVKLLSGKRFWNFFKHPVNRTCSRAVSDNLWTVHVQIRLANQVNQSVKEQLKTPSRWRGNRRPKLAANQSKAILWRNERKVPKDGQSAWLIDYPTDVAQFYRVSHSHDGFFFYKDHGHVIMDHAKDDAVDFKCFQSSEHHVDGSDWLVRNDFLLVHYSDLRSRLNRCRGISR